MRLHAILTGGILSSLISAAFAACSSSSSPSPTPSATGGSGGTADASATAGKAGDASSTAGTGGSSGGADAGDAAVGVTCAKLLSCDQACGSSDTCTNNCYAEATGVAQGLFNAFNDCLNAQCANSDASGCDTSAATGACITSLLACETDMAAGPPDPDGGVEIPDASDAGAGTGEANCGALVACIASCATGTGYADCVAVCNYSATPQALTLNGVLNACLNMACPITDGGVCATPGTACAGCQEQAVFAMPNTCAPQWTTCQNDNSTSSDAGATPTSLEDGGTLTTVVTGIVQAASALVVSGGYLYFTEVTGPSSILRVPLDDGGTAMVGDGGAITSIGPPQQTPAGIAVDAKNVYVWSYGTFGGTTSFNNDDGNVVQIPLNGDPAIVLDQGMETFYDAPYLNSIAIDSQNVYWVKGAMGSDGVIMRTAIGSANAAPIYTTQDIPEAIATDGTNVYWADWGTFDAEGASNNDATIWQGSVNGGTPLMLASNQQAPSAIAVDSQNVYWSNLGKLGASLFPATNSGSIMQVPIGGGAPIMVATSQAIPTGLAVGGGMIYWTVYGLSAPGLVLGAPVGGGTAIPLAGGLDDPFSLTLAGTTLYWTNTPSSNGGGTILSIGAL